MNCGRGIKQETIPTISQIVRPFVYLPVGIPLPKSMPYHG